MAQQIKLQSIPIYGFILLLGFAFAGALIERQVGETVTLGDDGPFSTQPAPIEAEAKITMVADQSTQR